MDILILCLLIAHALVILYIASELHVIRKNSFLTFVHAEESNRNAKESHRLTEESNRLLAMMATEMAQLRNTPEPRSKEPIAVVLKGNTRTTEK